MKKNILILGASSEIGLAATRLFLKNKWSVYAHYNKNKKKLEKIQSENQMLQLLKCNFENLGETNKFIKKIYIKQICSFVNLASYMDNKSYKESNSASLIKALMINTIIPIQIQRKLLPFMIKVNFGRILNVSSIGVKYGGGEFTYNYSFSKQALEHIPAYLRNLTNKNILTNVLRVGVLDIKREKKIKKKNMDKRIKLIPIKRAATASEVAETIFNLSSEKNTYIANEKITIAGGE
jgi:3-oxoacyl-[acyl-carrier protein] reductase